MGSKHENGPSFFKFLITENYDTQLRLSSRFVRRYGNMLPENAKLKISTGETWNVRLEKLDDDDHYFTEGWNKFVTDLKVQLLEFLVFWFDMKKSTFDVISYGLHGCNNHELAVPHEDIDNNTISKSDHNVDEEEEEIGHKLYFEIDMKNHHQSRVSLPRAFCKASGLDKEESVVLEYLPTHRSTKVTLDQRVLHNRTDMAKGWRTFREQNNLVFKNTYSFEFIPSKNVILVKEVKAHIKASGVGRKRTRAVIQDETVAWSDEEEEETKLDISKVKRFGEADGSSGKRKVAIECSERIISEKRSKPQIANEEGSKPYFEILLKEHEKYRVGLPQNFVVASNLMEEDYVELEYLPTLGRQVVSLDHRQRYRTWITIGWLEFHKSNGLVSRKRYSFEFNRDKNVIQVNEVKNVRKGRGSGNKRARAHNMVDDETNLHIVPKCISDDSVYGMHDSENYTLADYKTHDEVISKRSRSHVDQGSRLYFEVTLNTRHNNMRLNVPVEFARGALLTEEETVNLEYLPTHHYQEVTLVHRRQYITEMVGGWSEFRQTNGLGVGKSYSFEFNRDKNVIQVDEVKNVHNDGGMGNKRSKINVLMEDKDMSNPKFEFTLKEHQRSRVCVRKPFAVESGLINKEKVVLEYRGGHHVCVELIRRRSYPYNSVLELASGWGEFRKVNNLKFRKTYSFEFIRSKDVIRVKEVVNKKKY